MDLIQGLLFITPIFLLAIASPTPDFILVSQQTVSNGTKAGYACALGIIFGVFLHIIFAAIGLSVTITQSPNLLWIIKLVGGSFLIVFGLMVFKKKSSGCLVTKQTLVKKQNYLKSFAVGFFGNVFNPLAPLFFISIFTIVLSSNTPLYYIVIYGAWMLLLDLCRFVLVIKFLSIPKFHEKFQQWGVWVDRILGITLVVFGVILVTEFRASLLLG